MVLRIKNFILNSIKNLALNLRIKKYKYVHIMFNDKFNKPFVDFLNKKFNKQEHFVLCKRWYNEHPFPEGSNVAEIANLRFLNFSKNKKIICHSLFDRELINYLYKHKDILKTKAYWMIWGGDLYDTERDEKNDYVRCNFKGYISDTDGDCEVAIKTYNSNPEKYNAGYTFPITVNMLNNINIIKHDYIQIQINNSCDNSTLEMLDILSKFKDENIRITTILSYGTMNYKDEIIRKGTEIFGDKFEYSDNYLPPEEYTQKIAQNDILILNQNRQQGIGNCFAHLALGAKVFIKSEITTYQHFTDKNIKIFDTNTLKNITFDELIKYADDIKERNMKNSLIFFDDEYLFELWEDIFIEKINTVEYWHTRASKFGKHSVYHMGHPAEELDDVDKKQCDIYLNILKKYLTGNEENAIDFGCGPGRFEPMLSELMKNKVYALDTTDELLEIAPSINNVEYIKIENEDFKLADNSIDLVFISLVLGGITDKKLLVKNIAEMRRVAKPGALFFIVENTADEISNGYWHYRSVNKYKKLFDFCNPELVYKYDDLGEEISILVGKMNDTDIQLQ